MSLLSRSRPVRTGQRGLLEMPASHSRRRQPISVVAEIDYCPICDLLGGPSGYFCPRPLLLTTITGPATTFRRQPLQSPSMSMPTPHSGHLKLTLVTTAARKRDRPRHRPAGVSQDVLGLLNASSHRAGRAPHEGGFLACVTRDG